MSHAPRFYIETYGCQMNAADSELMAGVLLREGYRRAAGPEEAQLILVNTCSVREHAEQRALGRVGDLKRHKRPGDVLGVVGCMAQRLGERLLQRAPYVDFVAGPDGYRQLPLLVSRAREGERRAATTFDPGEHYEGILPDRASTTSAWVTVQRGCDYRCTFCVVPVTRGPQRSRRLADAVREVEEVASRGATEVTLLGQTVNSYHDGAHDFADLLRAVGAVAGIRRVRFTSPHPNDFSDHVVEAMAETDSVCEHVHVPVQSGSSAVLRRMLRRHTREQYLRLVGRLRAAIPDLAVTTDFLVGFPGETDEEFGETLSLVEEVGFDDGFTFRFSPREGTAAARLPDRVPDAVAAERLEVLIGAVRRVARARNAALVGATAEVLVETEARRGGLLQARTRQHRTVLLQGPPSWIGTYRMVRLAGTTGATFTGVPAAPAPEVVGA